MTRDEMLAIGMGKTKFMRRRLMFRSRVEPAMAEDCCQEALLAIIESHEAISREIESGADPQETIFRTMWRAASRFLYRNFFPVSKVKSLETPLSKEDDSLTLGDLVTYRSDSSEDIEKRSDARRAAKAMEYLSGEEIGILMSFADGVPLHEISAESGRSEIDVLTIKKKAAEKVQSSMTSLFGEKLMLAAIKNPASSLSKELLIGAE